MIKTICRFGLLTLFIFTLPAFADMETPTQKLVEYLQNLGEYFGYDITIPSTVVPPVSNLPNASTEQTLILSALTAFFNAIPVGGGAIKTAFKEFVPNDLGDELLTKAPNKTFSSYNTPETASSTESTVTVNPLIDQQTYQPDPVSQAVLNILSTPTSTENPTCSSCEGTGCNPPFCLSTIMMNLVGEIPKPTDFYKPSYNEKLVSQLNGNILIAPLLYSTTDPNPSNTQSSGASSTPAATSGLTAQSQAQEAANFIRNVIGNLIPPSVPSWSTYSTVYNKTFSLDYGPVTDEQKQAQAEQRTILATYLMSMRVYAAQSSIAISNLYSILSKRMPQTISSPSSELTTTTSQALREYQMATWRINNAGEKSTNQWIAQIDKASPATVQKEMAILLSEINYQLYLNRQQEERLLLTNTIRLIQGLTIPTGITEQA